MRPARWRPAQASRRDRVDLNGDGRIDLVVANSGDNRVSVFLGTEEGFTPGVEFACGTAPQYVLVADFNRDGKPDLAVVTHGNPDQGERSAVQFSSATAPARLLRRSAITPISAT